ncbi:GNAT family N-acetyltransferase [Actinoplanes aureus]|uniref:GNAT family N-acetyltransferase n=1 Tax=Actinoplanes aureus TaxID=2792083 RepID=A0A931C6N8_9ACTN|nr:GNAT family N-acetyltransferase [Actinoplanes aureus]MBG0563194.1 GNAT family N-acetyltransferase [Actinoplanes aureus]
MAMEIRTLAPSAPQFGPAAKLFDDYRVHYGQVSDLEGTRKWLTEQVGAGSLAMTVALRDDRVSGLITSTVMPASLRLGVAWSVRDLFVPPDARRGGVARALLDHVIAEARAAGALRVALQTEPENGPALALYTAAGFRPVDGLTSLMVGLN